MAVVQVGLGISTLLMYVPVHLAATHQVNDGDIFPFFWKSWGWMHSKQNINVNLWSFYLSRRVRWF